MEHALIRIADDNDFIDPKLLAEYLALFDACLLALNDQEVVVLGDDYEIPDAIIDGLKEISPLKWNEYFKADSSDVIGIETISKNSPIEVTILVSAVCLVTVAAILSGGKVVISLNKFEFELPPLGEGIKKLKDALGLGGKITSGYSIRTVRIKLNKEEFEALMLQDPSKKGSGGFQNFLINLQSKVNRNSRELVLNDTDLERIYRYKENPQKGGFQSRFKKIFERHFPSNCDELDI